MTTCIRTAWLTLGSLSLLLEDPSSGYFCIDLNLGSPTVREVTSNRPDQSGIDDRTSLLGSRAVSASIKALAGAGAQIDQVASSFAPFMDPSQRPVLHYILDRADSTERTLTLRAANYAWTVAGPYERDIQLSWVAADPIARSAVVKTATAWAAITGGAGRSYSLTFDRTYPAGGSGPGATTAQLYNYGDVTALPVTRIYGPGGAPVVTYAGLCVFAFLPSFVLSAGHYLDIDSRLRTVFQDGDPTQSLYQFVDWAQSSWPYIPPTPPGSPVLMTIQASSGSSITQAQATWQDAYLS